MFKGMSSVNRLIVKINGHEYTMCGEESREYLLRIATYVDEKMKEMAAVNPKLSTNMIAVLTALNTADDVFKYKEELDKIKKDYTDPLDDLNRLKNLILTLEHDLAEKNECIEQFEIEIEKKELELEELKKDRKDFNEILLEKDRKIAEADEMISGFQNKIYELQMKILELEK